MTNGRASKLRRENESLKAEVKRLREDLDALWVVVFGLQARIEQDKAVDEIRVGYTSRARGW